ncbi:permease [Marinobacter sp. F3R08]|uniref:permease n=1 Tax=Marinobacter sp. F3R08 TaxID=2841559 RepID=UPI001C08FC3D|nr:permease [Marinobacter sp. F3R08]MBU2953159.1 permease [Marinobacter sp. F3R08]
MDKNSWAVALDELLHVGGALILIIAVVAVLTGIIREYIPQDKLQKKLAKNEKRGPLVGALLGTLTPFCSASMVPVVMGMIEMRASMGMVFGFLISAPLCNFVVVGLIVAVLGWQVALVYLALTLGGAMLAGFVIGRTPLKHAFRRIEDVPAGGCGSAPAPACSASAPVSACSAPTPAATACTATAMPSCNSEAMAIESPSGQLEECIATACAPTSSMAGIAHKERMKLAMRFAWALFKRIIPYVLIGAVISALSAAFLPAEIVEQYIGEDSWYAIPVAASIGVPLYLRIEMALPLLQVLIAKGMGMGAAMALLIGGTGASLPEIAIISSVLKPKAVVAFVITVITLAIVGGVVFSVVF